MSYYTYCVAFRLANETHDGRSYSERWESIAEAINEEAGFWAEPTSFFLVSSTKDTASFVRNATRQLSREHDMLIAFDPSDMSMAFFGNVKEQDVVKSFFRTSIAV